MKENRIIWLSLFITSLVFIYFYGGIIPYTYFYIICILPVITFILNLISFLRFKFMQEIDIKHVIKGQKINFNYSIYNEDILVYPYVSIKFCNSDIIFSQDLKTVNLSLKPLSSVTNSISLECRYRGRYTIGIECIEFIDFLGIFKFKYTLRNPNEITVYPMIININRFNIKTNFASETQSRLSTGLQDYTTVSSIRKYSYGDSKRSIHWKLSAKMNELLVKKFEYTSEAETIIMFDLCNYNLSTAEATVVEDKLVETAVAVLNYCLSNYIKTHFIYYKNSMHNEEANNPSDFARLYEFLSTVEFDQNIPISDVADVFLSETIGKTNLIIFTANLNYSLYNTICKAHITGHHPILVYISPQEATGIKYDEEDEIFTALSERGIDTYKLNISSNTKEVLERQY